MTKLLIGVIAKDKVIDNITYQVISKNNIKHNSICNYIGILNYTNNLIDTNILDICDAIIFQGGNNIYPYHFQILDYAIKNHIPVLGICMGCQLIGLYSINSITDKDLIKINNHSNTNHTINTVKGSFLSTSLGDTIKVNSRHNYALPYINKPFKVTALSNDNIIEGIELIDNNNFILGVQFHPEDLNNMNTLYNNFIKEIIKRKKTKLK